MAFTLQQVKNRIKGLDPIQRADIVRQQIQILDNAEGVTQDVIDRANDLLLHAEEEEANYIADNNMTEGKDCAIIRRIGEDVRCEHYCNVKNYCNYYRDNKGIIPIIRVIK